MPLAVSATANAVSFKTGVMVVVSVVSLVFLSSRAVRPRSLGAASVFAPSLRQPLPRRRDRAGGEPPPTGKDCQRQGLRLPSEKRRAVHGSPSGRFDAAGWNARLTVRSPGGDLVTAPRTPVRAPVAIGFPDLRR